MQHAENDAASLNAMYKHLQTGRIYCLLMHASDKTTGEEVVVYQSVKTSRVWIRPSREFFDGRYVVVESSPVQIANRSTANAGSEKTSGRLSFTTP